MPLRTVETGFFPSPASGTFKRVEIQMLFWNFPSIVPSAKPKVQIKNHSPCFSPEKLEKDVREDYCSSVLYVKKSSTHLVRRTFIGNLYKEKSRTS